MTIIERRVYTPVDATELIHYLLGSGFTDISVIGSVGRGQDSTHDIDILLSGYSATDSLKNTLIDILVPMKVEDTDWGGWYMTDTIFGDIDFFFTTDNFDYL